MFFNTKLFEFLQINLFLLLIFLSAKIKLPVSSFEYTGKIDFVRTTQYVKHYTIIW